MNWEFRENFYTKYIKRLMDILVSVLFLILFWWIFLICGALIAFESGFPVIYRQVRIGRYGIPFTILKFRTMVKDADKIGKLETMENDRRITKIGKFLRTSSLDELPQLINVLKGDMSLVGFRPDVPRGQNIKFLKYCVRPGITGYAQVNGRSSLTTEEKKGWEERYVKEISFLLDIKIILKTVWIVLKREKSN